MTGASVGDLTREPLKFPAARDLRLQNLARGDEGFLLAMGYSTQRGYGRNHPIAGENPLWARSRSNSSRKTSGFAVPLGSIELTDTRTVASAARLYYEDAHSGIDPEAVNATPTGVAVFPYDFQSVRAFAERANTNIVHRERMAHGSHFAALDAPELLVGDLRAFYGRLR